MVMVVMPFEAFGTFWLLQNGRML